MAKANALRLLAEDAEGLGVIAAAVQDALVKPGDLKYSPRARTFGIELSRFQWEQADAKGPWFRSRALLAFTGVGKAQSQALPKDVDVVLSLLDIGFRPAEPPGGEIRLTFANGGALRLDVECVDVTLMDLGPTWPTRRKPDHRAAS